MRNQLVLIFFLIVIFGSCKEPFTPKLASNNNNLLIVEGFINISDSTQIKLSRTVAIANNITTTNPEVGATISIESETKEIYPLKEGSTGIYHVPSLNLTKDKKYRLNIKTAKGVNYTSDFTEVKIAPAIDNVGFEIKNDGLQINVSTHDDNKKSIYYRWEFEETWMFNPKYNSQLIYKSFDLKGRQPIAENIFECWGNAKSTTVVLGSSIKLNQDVISQSPIVFIPTESEKIGKKYSILVKQYVLSKEAYEFWDNLRKNTESLGSIFDAQPSQLTGNIQNVNDSTEPVIGYIGAGAVQTKRIFISKAQLPAVWKVKYPYECMPFIIPLNEFERIRIAFSEQKLIPVEFVENGVLGVSRECGDCTIRGINMAPSFWQ